MRIVFIANTLPPTDVSGVGEQVLQLAAGLRKAGHVVEVLGRGPGGAAGPKILFPLTIVWPSLKIIRRFRPDVVQVHESDGALAALAIRLFGGWLGRSRPRLLALLQVSYREERKAVRPLTDGREVFGRPGGVERRFRWFKAPLQIVLGWMTARLADLVLTPSLQTSAEIERDYLGARQGDRVKTAVVPNVTGGLEVPIADRPSLAADEAPGFLLFVGRLRVRKGVEVLLESVARLVDRGPLPVRLLIAGDGEHRAALEAVADRLDLRSRVMFLGRVPASGVRALLQDAAALVVPSTYEGMPLVILEAMEAAVPVIASRVSGIPEVVIDGETGWLVEAERPEELAGAIEAVLIDPAEAARRGTAGRERLDAHYRPRHGAEAWLRAIGGTTARSNREDEDERVLTSDRSGE